MLTNRQQHIVIRLLDNRNTIRIKDLSTDLGVSTRTIKYDLDIVKVWLTEQGAIYYSQRNKGIGVQCDEGQRSSLKYKVQKLGNEEIVKNQQQRIQHVITILMVSDGYVTAQHLADGLEVSRNTILADLSQVEKYIGKWFLFLERKPRQGYRILGEELYIRLLLEHLIFQKVSNHDGYFITQYIKGEGDKEENLFHLPEPLASNHVYVLRTLKSTYGIGSGHSLPYQDLLSMLIRLTISITRMKLGKSLSSCRIFDGRKWNGGKKKMIAEAMRTMCSHLAFPMLEEEFLYIDDEMKTMWKDLDIAAATQQIIKYTSIRENNRYRQDPTLFSNLLPHLSSRLRHGTTYLLEENPFRDEIQNSHPSLIKTLDQAAKKYLSPHGVIIHDSFITLMALHFIASNERETSKKDRIQALYVCSTGRGVARIIKNKVEREIKGIDVIAHCSVREVEKMCTLQKVDVIISVFPIEAKKPVLVVDPALSQRDILVIQQFIENETGAPCPPIPDYQSANSGPLPETAEGICEDIIVKGFQMAQELDALMGIKLCDERKPAFMMHVFLMVHRYYFQKQYDYFQFQPSESFEGDMHIKKEINKIAGRHHMKLNESEIAALLQYIQ
ncbi:BglG family transcription antiterminator [Bacillus sp. 1P06AnD]|uniref:BglG family transcription antiterminator n=1 Tax=Bacillus sp. 1P06AnD TaxID=3132208 RepID=UPI0039A0C2B8